MGVLVDEFGSIQPWETVLRIRQRRIAAVIGLVMGFLAVGVLPVQAAPADGANSGSTTLARGVSDTTTKAASVAAAEPTTSPAASRRYRVPVAGSVDCPSGYACAVTNYYADGGWQFDFYSYGTYSLSNWYGQSGTIVNNQTGGAGMRLLDRNRNVIRCQWAGTGDIGIDWDPVWYISLSPTPC